MTLGPGYVGQLCTELDGRHYKAPLSQRLGRLVGATADLDHPTPPGQVTQFHQVVEHLSRADRPRTVEGNSVAVEASPQPSTL
jgi:hypothetical protein